MSRFPLLFAACALHVASCVAACAPASAEPDSTADTFATSDDPREAPTSPTEPTSAPDVAADAVAPSVTVLLPGTPSDAPSRFAAAPASAACAPVIVYPEPLTVIPSNLEGLTFQWRPEGHTLFRVRISLADDPAGPRADFYTTDTQLTPGGDPWTTLLHAAAGGALAIELAGLGGAGDAACVAPVLPIQVDRSALVGAIYYWSTADFGVMRLAFGARAPESFYTPREAPGVYCVGCHAISRDGRTFAAARVVDMASSFGVLQVASVAAPAVPNYAPGTRIAFYPSFDPSGTRLVANADGHLQISAAATGQLLTTLPSDPGYLAGSADWSWQGDAIVATYARADATPPAEFDLGQTRGAIARWAAVGDGWSAPELLVPATPSALADHPAFSPDGAFVAFQRFPPDDALGVLSITENPESSLWIVPSDGASAPVALARANQGPGLTNTWPKWAPPALPAEAARASATRARPSRIGAGRRWLAFSSTRPYGHLSPSPEGNLGARPQIWITAIDPAAPPGDDPSSPAFWMPYQNLQSGNHLPFWAVYSK